MRWWASICSIHQVTDPNCNMCKAGRWVEGRRPLMESDLTKAEIKKLVADELSARMDKLGDKFPDKNDVKEMIRDTIVSMYKQLWLKSAVFIKQI